MAVLMPVAVCVCDAQRTTTDRASLQCLVQFNMGLDDGVQNKIL
uniref:Uncharacterized protein n=1 Tax=Utricularia reniformis TaxID=192314 RepID=A0A1Y0AZC3_9LAMI|nr:hypothetical protein AEK19_MT0212 [Utricularia reniformis]ART30490.1 hypothetical protein AEK19_MT0212 [Utricularia reniformis]